MTLIFVLNLAHCEDGTKGVRGCGNPRGPIGFLWRRGCLDERGVCPLHGSGTGETSSVLCVAVPNASCASRMSAMARVIPRIRRAFSFTWLKRRVRAETSLGRAFPFGVASSPDVSLRECTGAAEQCPRAVAVGAGGEYFLITFARSGGPGGSNQRITCAGRSRS